MAITAQDHPTDAAPAPQQKYLPNPLLVESTKKREVNRGMFLRSAGRGAGLVAVAAGGFGTWRAVDEGVFATGTGPAYTAWNDWAGQPGGGAVNLVRAAVLAANAHDSQPWLFHVAPNRIDLLADQERNIGTVDPLRREMHLSLGCALENLLLAAAPHGYLYDLLLLPNPRNPSLVATIRLRQGNAPTSPLYGAIPDRHTNRGAYDTWRPVDSTTLQQLQALNTVPDIGIIWYTGAAQKQAFTDLTIQATEAFNGDLRQSTDDFAWWRGDWSALQRDKSGITIDASGLSPLVRALGKMLPPQTRISNGQAWLDNTRNTQLNTTPVFGILVARNPRNVRQRLEGGRLWERMQLWGTTMGLAMQPLNQTVERAEREQTAGFPPRITNGLATLIADRTWHAIMPFRLGYPTTAGLKSPRRPADEVVVKS